MMLESLAVAAVAGAVTAGVIIGALRADLRWLREVYKAHDARLAALERRPVHR